MDFFFTIILVYELIFFFGTNRKREKDKGKKFDRK